MKVALIVIFLSEGILVDGITIFEVDFREIESNDKKQVMGLHNDSQDGGIYVVSNGLLEIFI